MDLKELYLGIENEIKSINKLIQHFEELIDEDKNKILDKFPALEKKEEDKLHPPNEIVLEKEMYPNEALDYYQSTHDFYRVSFTYPKILWPTLFLSLFSFFEHVLHRLCTIVAQGEPDYEKNSRSTLKKYQAFLKKKGINFPDQIPIWNTILFYKKIRHVIVHNRSHIETFKLDSNVVQKIQETHFLSINNGYIILEPIFLKQTMQVFQDFIYKLFDEIQKNA